MAFRSTSDEVLHFTGKQRDSESGNDYFGARYYAENDARWMTPDWSSIPEAISYANIANPQSLNLYSYVLNNPLGGVDADGHHTTCSPDTYSTGKNGSLIVHAGKCHVDLEPISLGWMLGSMIGQTVRNHPWLGGPNAKSNTIGGIQLGIIFGDFADGGMFLGGGDEMELPANSAQIPANALKTLDTIDASGSAGPDYFSRDYQNDGRGGTEILPKTGADGTSITYKEWDVNPHRPGVNRGVERLVTGSNGSAYYTNNHYLTFIKIR